MAGEAWCGTWGWPNLSSSRFARAAAVATLRLGPALEASAQDSTVRVTGVVREAESNAPVSGALIRIPERGLQTLTSLGGGFAFEAVPDGTYTIRVDRIGYAVIEQVLVVGASDSTLVLARESRGTQLTPLASVPPARLSDLQELRSRKRRASGIPRCFQRLQPCEPPRLRVLPTREERIDRGRADERRGVAPHPSDNRVPLGILSPLDPFAQTGYHAGPRGPTGARESIGSSPQGAEWCGSTGGAAGGP